MRRTGRTYVAGAPPIRRSRANRKHAPWNSQRGLTKKEFYANMGGRGIAPARGGTNARPGHPLDGIWNLGRSEPFTGSPREENVTAASVHNNNAVVQLSSVVPSTPELTRQETRGIMSTGGHKSKTCERAKRGQMCGTCYERVKGR